MFVRDGRVGSRGRVSRFGGTMVLDGRGRGPGVRRVGCSAPICFSVRRICQCVGGGGDRIVGGGSALPRLPGGDSNGIVGSTSGMCLARSVVFSSADATGSAGTSGNPCGNRFREFIAHLRAGLSSGHLGFVATPGGASKRSCGARSFSVVLRRFLKCVSGDGIAVVSLDTVPFRILDVIVDLLSHMVFSFTFRCSGLHRATKLIGSVPFVLIYRRTRGCVPGDNKTRCGTSGRSVREVTGRKEGCNLGLVMIDREPSRMSRAVFSRYGGFVILGLAGIGSRGYVGGLLPSGDTSLISALPALTTNRYLMINSTIPLPTIMGVGVPGPAPDSDGMGICSR